MIRSAFELLPPFFVLIAALAVPCPDIPAQEPPRVERRLPTAALIDLDRSPAAILLEARLLAGGQANWVERTEIDRVLKEQELATAFGAQGGKDRLALGKLLKAEVLVLLRMVRSKEKGIPLVIECVVCETHQGLRLQVAAVSAEEVESAVAALEEIVQKGLRKHLEKISEIVAVPPLVSDDLGFGHSHLQSAYAKCLEQVLLETSGLVVVEFAEAQAIAQEVALTAPGAGVARKQLPLYVLGRYRHYGVGDTQTVAIRVRLARGNQELIRREQRNLTPDKAPVWLREQVVILLAEAKLAPAASQPTEIEARLLAERAREFHRIGNWDESLALIEASLLLDPHQETLHRDAVVALERLMKRHWRHAPLPKEEVARGLGYYVRGLAHVEAFLRTAGPLEGSHADQRKFISEFEVQTNSLVVHPLMEEDAREVVEQVRELRTNTYVRIAAFRAARGFGDEGWVLNAWNGIQDQQQRFDMLLQVIDLLREAPDLTSRLDGMWTLFRPQDRASAAYQDFLAQLEKMPNEDVRKFVRQVKSKETTPAPTAAKTSLPAAIPSISDHFTFNPIELQFEDPASGRPSDFVIEGWLPVSGGRDLFWINGLYLMERKGNLKLLWKLDELNVRLASIVFDGRFAWVTARRHRRPAVLVAVDLDSGEVFRFSADDGLPLSPEEELPVDLPPERIVAAAVSPGKVCLAGFLGHSWIGIGTISPQGKRQVEVFHEARLAEDSSDPTQVQNVEAVFHPTFTVALSRQVKLGEVSGPIVIVGRESRNHQVSEIPLVVDPQAHTVRLATFSLLADRKPCDMAVTPSGMLFIRKAREQPTGLMQVSAVDLQEQRLTDAPEGFLLLGKRGLEIFGQKWWRYDPERQVVDVVADSVPWYFQPRFSLPPQLTPTERMALPKLDKIGLSNHYGMLMQCTKLNSRSSLFEVHER